jgi:hypothetical protein
MIGENQERVCSPGDPVEDEVYAKAKTQDPKSGGRPLEEDDETSNDADRL